MNEENSEVPKRWLLEKGYTEMVLGIYGSGGAGRETKEIASLQGIWDEIVFIDDTVSAGSFKRIKRMPFEEFKGSTAVKKQK